MIHAKNPQQAEEAIRALFEKYDIRDTGVDDIKRWILHSGKSAMASSLQYQKKCLNLFPPMADIDEMDDILQVFVDAWNFFPHQSLQGRSPNEMIDQMQLKHPPAAPVSNAMPTVIVGGREMKWEEYGAMLREMEQAQEPFRQWIERDALPKYKQYLAQMVAVQQTRDEHYNVADVFFQRALHLGFTDAQSIRPAFIRSEFPRWWPTHVIYSDLKPAGVRKSLLILVAFLELVYGMDVLHGSKI